MNMLALIDPLTLFAVVAIVLVVGVLAMALLALRLAFKIVFGIVRVPFRIARRVLGSTRRPPPLPSFRPIFASSIRQGVLSCPNRMCRNVNPLHARFCSRCGLSCAGATERHYDYPLAAFARVA
jgi:hypothetical protein